MHGIVAFLISLAVGFWLLTLAEKQNDYTKTLGKVFAWIIIAVSLLGPVCMASMALCRHSHGGGCGYSMWENGNGWHRHGMGASGMMNGQCPMDEKDSMMKGHMGSGGKGMMDMDKGTTEDKENSK